MCTVMCTVLDLNQWRERKGATKSLYNLRQVIADVLTRLDYPAP